jgi:uncharacterized protein
MPTLIRKKLEFKIKEVNEQNYTIRAIISSGQPDRQGEIVDQASWNLEEYKKNPVVLWAHDHSQPSIGKAIEIFVNTDGMLEAEIQFAVKEYAFAETIFKLYTGGYMCAFSVGFVSDNYDEANGFRILKNNTLYEFSAVNVGADALALAKTKGIDVSFFEKKQIVEKEGRVLSSKSRGIIEKAKSALDEVLTADSEKDLKKPDAIKAKFNYRKVLGKAARELIKARNE